MINTDCLILGGGLAGRMAAREIISRNREALMLHDGMGASPWVHGFSVPVREGDSAEAFLEDTLKSGQGLSDPALAKALCEGAEIVFEELRKSGLSFNREGGGYQALRPLGAAYPRVVSIGNETGAAILGRLGEEQRGVVREMPGARALRLLTSNGRVTGALAFDTSAHEWVVINAGAVVLACGGYCGIYPVSTNKRDSGGDGVAMAYEAGAALCDMEFIQFEPSAAVWPTHLIGTGMITTLFFEGAVLRNRDGERFMLRYGPEGERVGKDVLSRCIYMEIASGKGTEHGGVYMDLTGVDAKRLENDYSMYVKRYRDVGIELSRDYIELAPAPHTSLGGVRIDADCNTSLTGLFACGEVTGGLHGANRIGGSAGLETLVFGRRAGISAAEYASSSPREFSAFETPEAAGGEASGLLRKLRGDMGAALMSGVNAVRNDKALKSAADVFESGLCELEAAGCRDAREAFEHLRLKNDMTAAYITALSALTRDDSLGCHVRSDFPDRAPEAYRVTARRGADGKPDIRKEILIR